MHYKDIRAKLKQESLKDEWIIAINDEIIENGVPLHQASIAALNIEDDVPVVRVLHVDDQSKQPQPWVDLIMPGITKAPFSTHTEHTKTTAKPKRLQKKGNLICKYCGFIGKPKIATKGNIGVEIMLWLFLLLPGLLYSTWRLISRVYVCPECGEEKAMFKEKSRPGQLALKEFYSEE